jgi:transposase
MNIHKNARLTLARRIELVQDITVHGLSACVAAQAHGVSAPTARKWLGRYLALGDAGLTDASSRPAHSPRRIEPAKALAVVELRHKRLTQARIAAALSLSRSTVGRVLARAGLSRLSDLQPAEPVVRYEHPAPGDMLHIDTKKLGRIVRPSHRVTGDRRDSVDGAGWEMLFVAIDDHARIAFTDIHPDEKAPNAPCSSCATRCLLRQSGRAHPAPAHRQRRRLPLKGLRTGCRSWASATSSPARTGHKPTARPKIHPVGFTRVGLRLHLPELQRAYAALDFWNHHYNWHRPHQGIGGVKPPCPDSIGHETTS